jgi:hypothetical protein
MKEFSEVMFSVRSVLRLYSEDEREKLFSSGWSEGSCSRQTVKYGHTKITVLARSRSNLAASQVSYDTFPLPTALPRQLVKLVSCQLRVGSRRL